MKKTTITIAIPAYNEEKNIASLLQSLITQYLDEYLLDRILVVSDGSTDQTVEAAKSVYSKKIQVRERKKRLGLAQTQNEICKHTTSDILIMLNADIRINGKLFIKELIDPMKNKIDLLSSPIIPRKPTKGFFQRMLYVSMLYKNSLFDSFRSGNNVYTCHGPVKAFSKKLYKHILFQESVGEDMYAYFFCKTQGYTYFYNQQVSVSFLLPHKVRDHINQSVRFFTAKLLMEKTFNKKYIEKELAIPLMLSMQFFFLFLIQFPISMTSYAIVTLSMLIYSKLFPISLTTWNEVASSKEISL